MKKIVLLTTCALSFVAPQAFAKDDKKGASSVEEQLRFKVGDEKGNELKALKTEMLVMNAEKKAFEQLKKLEVKYRGTGMEPELMLRKGELYMRRARTERFFEVHKDSSQVLSLAPKLVQTASEKAEIRKAIDVYKTIQTRFPNFRSMDVVIFNTAYAFQQLGEDSSAETQLAKLIKEHEESPLVPDSYLGIGEINFNRKNFAVALTNFLAVKKYPQARVYPYGIYKAAWTYYNLQDAASGLKQLEDVVAFGHRVATNNLDAKLDLRKEALNDMALFFEDVKPATEAVSYFKKQSAELDAVPFLMRLSEIYNRHSRYGDIEKVLKDVLKGFPDSQALGQAHEELVWNFERMRERTKAGEQMHAFDQWCESQVKTAKKAKGVLPGPLDCQTKLTDATRKLSGKWHALWKKQGGPDELAATAEQTYRLYIKNANVKDPELPVVRYAFADLLFARNRFRDASESYAGLEQDAVHTKIDPKVAHDASYAALVSLEKATADKWNDTDEKRFVQLSDSYITRFPKGEYVFDLRFKRAFIAYEKGRYDEAAPQFYRIGWTDAAGAHKNATERVTRAQDLYLDILNIRKDYKGIKDATQALLKGSSHPAVRVTHIEKIYREAYFSEIQATEEKGEVTSAIDAYKKFALENKSSELAPKAWWNASQLQFKIGNAEGGALTCHEMYSHFPKNPNSKDCLTKAANTYENMGRLDHAAEVVLELANLEKEKADHWKEIAADFTALGGAREKAIGLYGKLVDNTKNRGDQLRMLEKIMALATELKDHKTLEQLETRFSRDGIEPHASRLIVEQAEDAYDKKDMTKAFNLSKKIVGRDGLPKDLSARARFVQARVLEDEYRQASLKTRADRLGMVLAIKTERLEKAQKAYQSSINYGDPKTSVRALRKLAECYIDYSRSVRGMTFMDSLPEKDQQALRGELEQLAIPMEEKGIEAMGQALEAAKKAQLRDTQVSEIQAEVDKLNMKSTAAQVTVTRPVVYVPKFNVSMQQEAGL